MSGPKVLVVDDHRETLEILALVLKLAGFEVTAKADGLSALDTPLDDYAAVVTDLAMPRMDGTELVRQLRARMTHPVPIVVLTGQGMPLERLDCRCCVLLLKPSLPDDLTSTLRGLMESCAHECESCSNARRQQQSTDLT
jgi:CheY-like chemotaxis protein